MRLEVIHYEDCCLTVLKSKGIDKRALLNDNNFMSQLTKSQ